MRFPRTTFAFVGKVMAGTLIGAVAASAHSVPAASAAHDVLLLNSDCQVKKMKVKKVQKVNEWNQGADYFYRLKGKARLSGNCASLEGIFATHVTKPFSFGNTSVFWYGKKGNKYTFAADLGPSKGRKTVLTWEDPSTGKQRAIYAKRGAKLLRTVPAWAQPQ